MYPAAPGLRRVLDPLPPALELKLRRWSPRQRRDPLARLLEMMSLPGTLAVDVGAHRGRYTSAMLAGGAQVLAIEANPTLSRRLAAALPDGRGRVISGAAGAEVGEAELRFPPGGRTGEATTMPGAGGRISVQVVRVDDFASGHDMSVIKIDVEGAEFEVLRGAEAAIHRSRPAILMEIERRHTGEAVEDSFDRIRTEFGYHPCLAISSSGVMSIDRFQPEAHQYGIHPSSGAYINNFFFVHGGALRGRSESPRMVG